MTTEDLLKTIDNIAQNQKIEKEVIIDDIIEILKIKYGEILLEKEKELVAELKNKIVTRLYGYENHQVDISKVNLAQVFHADRIDMEFAEKAEGELIAEGLLVKEEKNLKLTDAGIMKYKKFYGEV